MKAKFEKNIWIIALIVLAFFLAVKAKGQCWKPEPLYNVIGGMQISKSEGFWKQSVRAGITTSTPIGLMTQFGAAQYLEDDHTISLSTSFQADIAPYFKAGKFTFFTAFGGNNKGLYVRPGFLFNAFGQFHLEAYYLQNALGFGFLINFKQN